MNSMSISFAIIFGAYVIADAICYVHGHKSLFFAAKTDYEKELIKQVREGK